MNYSRSIYLQFVLTLVVILAVSCDEKDDLEVALLPADYLPLQHGLYQIYDVSEIRYVLGVPETLAYELKTVVTDSFMNSTGSYSYVINRSTRNQGENSWTYKDTWSAHVDNREVVVNEENIAYLKFRFPRENGFEWNGNKYNDLEEDIYSLLDLGTDHTYNGTTYADCITVNQNNNEDYIVFLDQRNEAYARDIGLVNKETTQLHYCTQAELGCLGKQIVEEGLIYRQTLKDHGLE